MALGAAAFERSLGSNFLVVECAVTHEHVIPFLLATLNQLFGYRKTLKCLIQIPLQSLAL